MNGSTKKGKRKPLLFTVLLALSAFTGVGNASEIPQDVEWNRTYEDNVNFNVETVKQTSDGGFIIAGGDWLDVRLVKTDPTGIMQWNTTIKSTCNGWVYSRSISIRQTLDCGYILSYERLCDGHYCDFKIVKLDPNGNEQWNRSFFRPLVFLETPDDSIVMAGRFAEKDIDYRRTSDIWLKKLDYSGNIQSEVEIEGTDNGIARYLTQTSDGSYIITGETAQRGSNYDIWILKINPSGTIYWKRTFEKYRNIRVDYIRQTSDSGYIIAGDAGNDLWLLKTDPNGIEQWNQIYKGIEFEYLQQTSDNGYFIFASDCTIRTDHKGNMQWVRISEKPTPVSFQPTFDGGFIVAGNNDSGIWLKKLKNYGTTPYVLFTPKYPGVNQIVIFDASLSYNPGGNSTIFQWNFGDGNITNTSEKITNHSYAASGVYSVKLTLKNWDGTINSTTVNISVQNLIPPQEEWNRTFGGIEPDRGKCAQQTSDGGYIIAGDTFSYGAGILLVKTDSKGNKLWKRTFGGIDDQSGANSVRQTFDGGYILTGAKRSFDDNIHSLWLVKTDSNGNKQWDRSFTGTGYEGFCVRQTSDGGYVIAGITKDYRKFIPLLVKTDPNGNKQWSKNYGENGKEVYSVEETLDGGYIIAGSTYQGHVLLLKTDSKGERQWVKRFDGKYCDTAKSVAQTSDGGYILAGGTWLPADWNSDLLLIKTDSNGNMQWNRTFGGAGNDDAEFVRQTIDGGYIIAGKTMSYGAGMNDFWLIKTDSNGILQWHNTYGDTGNDEAYSVYQTFDGGYIIAGEKESGFNEYDFWLIKLKGDSIEPDKTNPLIPDEVSTPLESIPTHPSHTPGFGAVFSIGNLLVVAYLVFIIMKKQ